MIMPDRCTWAVFGMAALTGEVVGAAESRGTGILSRSPLASAAVEDTNTAATASATSGFINGLRVNGFEMHSSLHWQASKIGNPDR
jgi:hypothetical protein